MGGIEARRSLSFLTEVTIFEVGSHSLTRTAAKIKAKPTTTGTVKLSLSKSIENSTPKTDSKLKISDPCDGCTFARPMFCKSNAAHVANRII